jgi:hypothetical protein
MQASVCRLLQKTDRERTTWDAHRDLMACFMPKPNRARVSQSGLKTGGGVTTGGARGIIMKVASRGS